MERQQSPPSAEANKDKSASDYPPPKPGSDEMKGNAENARELLTPSGLSQHYAITDQQETSATGELSSPAPLMKYFLTPSKYSNRGILRPPETPGTGQSVRFGKRMYDDGDESKMSSCAGHSANVSSPSASETPAAAAVESGSELSNSADLVEMSLMSIGQSQQSTRHPYARVSPQPGSASSSQMLAESSSDSAGFPPIEGYSSLEDVSFAASQLMSGHQSRHISPSSARAVSRHGYTSDEGCASNEMDKSYPDVIHKEDTSTGWSPWTTDTHVSDYRSARSRASTASPESTDGGREAAATSSALSTGSAKSLGTIVEDVSNDFDPSSYEDTQHSPSALKAQRQQKLTSAGHQPASRHSLTEAEPASPSMQDVIHSMSWNPEANEKSWTGAHTVGPGTLVRSQTTPSFLSLSLTSTSSSSASHRSRTNADSRTVKELLQAADELDRAHYERSETLLRRVQSVEREAADLRHGRARDRTAREKQKQALKNIEELIRKLKRQLAQRAVTVDEEGTDLVETIEEHLHATRLDHKGSQVGSVDGEIDGFNTDDSMLSLVSRSEIERDQSASRDRLEMMIREELERDFEAERYKLRRDHEMDLQRLMKQVSSARHPSGTSNPHSETAPSQGARHLEVRKEGLDSQCPESVHIFAQSNKASTLANTSGQSTGIDQNHGELLELVSALETKLQSEMKARLSVEGECLRIKEELQSQWRYAEKARLTETQLRDDIVHLEEQLEKHNTRAQKTKEEGSEKGLMISAETKAVAHEETSLSKSRNDEAMPSLQEAKIRAEAKLQELTVHCQGIEEKITRANSDHQARENSFKKQLEDYELRIEIMETETKQLHRALLGGPDSEQKLQGGHSELVLAVVTLKAELLAAKTMCGKLEDQIREQNAQLVARKVRPEEFADMKGVAQKDPSAIAPLPATGESLISNLDQDATAELKMNSMTLSTTATSPQLQRRVREVERELADRGLAIVKLRKAKARLEQDNFNYSIALSAKQQELSLIKRSHKSKSQLCAASSKDPFAQSRAAFALQGESRDPSLLLRDIGQRSIVNATAIYEDTTTIEGDEAVFQFRKGPSQIAATRRRTSEYGPMSAQ